MGEMLVSIVINNYNYARFLRRAIESALNQEYAPCEVIVVDDGSQDGSIDIINGFGGRVRPVLKENGGQASALNAGFAASQGEIVIFLDADDQLEPQAVQVVVEAFLRRPETARVQYRLAVIDAHGNRTGETKPVEHTPVPSGDIRWQVLHFPFDVPWLPTSGNAFSASVLRQIMPIPKEYGYISADYYLVHTAALFGLVLFLDQTLGCYRIHGKNNFESQKERLDLERLRSTIHYDELTFHWIRQRALEAGLGQHIEIPERNFSVSTIASRLASLKLEPEAHPLKEDRLLPLMALGVNAALKRIDTSQPARWVFSAWFILMGLSPRFMARWWADLFFFPGRRKAFSRLLGRQHQKRSVTSHGGDADKSEILPGIPHLSQQSQQVKREEG